MTNPLEALAAAAQQLDPSAFDAGTLSQLGVAGAIIGAVVYMQRAGAANLKQMVSILAPLMDVRADLSKLEGKVDAFAAVLAAQRHAPPPPEPVERPSEPGEVAA